MAFPLRQPQDIFIWHRGRPVRYGEFIGRAQALAAQLPDAAQAVNLCEDRYLFLLALMALLLRGQVCLLPPSRAPRTVEKVAAGFDDVYCLVEQAQAEIVLPQYVIELESLAPEVPQNRALDSSDDRLAIIIYTSGSTGEPQPQKKYWGDLLRSAERAYESFKLLDLAGGGLVATVPPQHMYGLDTSIFYPLCGPLSVHSGRPFFPSDLQKALAEMPAPRLLITTPVHLRAFVGSGLAWPKMALVISATAPLTLDLARAAEQAFGCEVHEIYGSTETGSIAHRRTLNGEPWTPYRSVLISCDKNGCSATADFLRGAELLHDQIELRAQGFVLHGRHADMLNIAGKRASLGELTQILLDVPGVRDAAMLLLETDGERRGRLCAFIVAPDATTHDVQEALRARVDPVFVPRIIYKVDRLPRNSTGKLPRADLMTLYDSLRGGSKQEPHGIS